ncbi:MAG: hypothetical protein KDI59_00685 [Xanthomonadales bacterium]|nr:hypothetical protein [Xanthomonadales bacterium]
MKKYIHTYIHTYILACLIFASVSHAVNYHAIENRPDFVSLNPQPMTNEHIFKAGLGHENALINASYIRFNKRALSVFKGENGKFYEAPNTQMSGQQIPIKVPDSNQPLFLNFENVQNLIEGEDVVTYTGHVEGDTGNFFTISVDGDNVMGKINYGKFIYIIAPLEGPGNKHSIAKLEKRLMNKDTSEDVIGEEGIEKKAVNYVEKWANGTGYVKVLFYFSSDVYWPSAYVSTIVSEMNAALFRSGVASNNSISSAGMKIINSTFSGQCKYDILNKMGYSLSEFSNIQQDIVTYGADIAVLIVRSNTGQQCQAGFSGRVGGLAYGYLSQYPFAVVADSYALGDLTALHEIGHIFGGAHAVAGGYPGVYSYSRGLIYFDHQNPDNSWQTIMGAYGTGSDDCVFNGPYSPCERIDYFSNPSKYYNGIATGASNRNMKQSLNNTMPIVSGWRGNALTVPSAPNPISSQSGACYGMNTIHWTAQSSATQYKLYSSSSSSFGSPALVYSGSATGTFINVAGTEYLRAKACNSAGCSAYSNQVVATYTNGCF